MTIHDVRRHVGELTNGGVRLMIAAEGAYDDVVGAVASGQPEAARYAARTVAVTCLSVRSLLGGTGELLIVEHMSFDPFAGLDAAEIDAGLALVRDGWGQEWLDRLRAYIDETEAMIGLDAPLPKLRAADGFFGGLRLARQWLPLTEELGLPSVIPHGWAKAIGSAGS